MYGTITFTELKELAEFLLVFTGNTAKFAVTKQGDCWVLEFTGGF